MSQRYQHVCQAYNCRKECFDQRSPRIPRINPCPDVCGPQGLIAAFEYNTNENTPSKSNPNNYISSYYAVQHLEFVFMLEGENKIYCT
jgi:hypothetical protein